MELIFTMFWTTYAASNTKTAIATATVPAPGQIEQHLLCKRCQRCNGANSVGGGFAKLAAIAAVVAMLVASCYSLLGIQFKFQLIGVLGMEDETKRRAKDEHMQRAHFSSNDKGKL